MSFKKEVITNLINQEVLNTQRLSHLKENSMLLTNPMLWEIWDFDKNSELGLDIYKLTKGVNKIAWWHCKKCNSNYDMAINKKVNNRGCPYCAGYRINHTNSLSSRNSILAAQWHPTKNGELTPDDIVCGNTKKVWWLGECGHEWQATTHNRFQGNTGCPYCVHNPKVLIGFNDLWTTHSHVATLLKEPKIGYMFTFGSNQKVVWICPDCKNENSNTVHDLHKRSVRCKKCSDSLSLGEKIIYSLLKSKNIEFSHEISFSWSGSRRYDFYVSSLNIIIEAHGEQHYVQSNRGKRTLEEEQENDTVKKHLAEKNGIPNYIVINTSSGDVETIVDNILLSDLKEILSLERVIFNQLNINYNLLTIDAWKLWNEGYRVMQISKKMNISKNAVRRYLKLGNMLEFIDYKVENRYERTKRSIYKIDLEGNIVSNYESLLKASEENGHYIRPNKQPFNKFSPCKGFYWVYEDEYAIYKKNTI